MLLLSVLIGFGLSPASAFAERALLPIDQARQQADFSAFRARLLDAISRKDKTALLAVVHPEVLNSFGGDGGVTEFVEQWKLNGEASPVWPVLESVLRMGGSFEGPNRFSAPYVYSAWPSDRDAFEWIAVIKENVPVHAQPNPASPLLVRRSFCLLKLGEVKDWNASWIPVQLDDGRSGFVAKAMVRSATDYRAIFEKTGKVWQLKALVAGD